MPSTTTIVARRAIPVDLRDRHWQAAVARALERDQEAVVTDVAVLVRCGGSCRSHNGYHRVTWETGGLACDCPSRYPCAHRARAYLEWMGWWERLARLARIHGTDAAVRYLLWQETGELDVSPIRALCDVRLWRDEHGAHAQAGDARWDDIEWGYGGSGPHRLAATIIVHFYGPAAAEALAQRLKWELIASIPHDAQQAVITAEQLSSWMQAALRGEVRP